VLLTGKSGTELVDVAFDTIAKAKVEVEFSPPSAAVRELLGTEDLTADIDEPDEPDELDETGEELADGTIGAPGTGREAHR
jgi:ribosome maturation factor RimP